MSLNNIINCSWKCLQQGCRCRGCGFKLPQDYENPPIRNCSRPGWGTRIAVLLSKRGIKKCGSCGVREEKINLFGWWIKSKLMGLLKYLFKSFHKSKRRKKLAKSPPQETADRQEAKEKRRQALLEQQRS